MNPQDKPQNTTTATEPAPQAPAPAPAAAPAAPEAPAAPAAPAATPVKSGSKLPMWLLVVFVLVVIAGVAYYLMS